MKNYISLTVTTVLLTLSNLSAGTLFVCPESTESRPAIHELGHSRHQHPAGSERGGGGG